MDKLSKKLFPLNALEKESVISLLTLRLFLMPNVMLKSIAGSLVRHSMAPQESTQS